MLLYLYVFFLWHFSLRERSTNAETHTRPQRRQRKKAKGQGCCALIRNGKAALQLGKNWAQMQNGVSVPSLVKEFFRPLSGLLDYIFAAGVAYGAVRLGGLCRSCLGGFRVYCLPFGRCDGSDLKKRFGEWAGEVVGNGQVGWMRVQ